MKRDRERGGEREREDTDLDPLTGIEKIPKSSIFFSEVVTDTK